MEGIEFRAIIYNAAQQGNLKRMKVFLECNRSAEWIESCLNSSENDKIPLVIASRHGFTQIVRYLLEKGANPSVTGVVSFDGESIHGTPPLWAAAAAGHFEIVQLLVEEANACINQATCTQSTPLRGACYDGHMQIVEYLADHGADLNMPNRHGHTPLMIASFRDKVEVVKFLISRGVDLHIQTAKGNSALHDAAEGGNIEVVRVLLEAGGKLLPDEHGHSPLITSAMCGHAEIVELLLDHAADNMQRRDALKLLGCTHIDKKMDVAAGVECWRRAVKLELNAEEWKKIVEIETFTEPKKVYDNAIEIHRPQELSAIESDLDKIRMQSLVIRERILGGCHPDVHYFLRFRGAVYCDLGRMERCYELWRHALQLQQKYYSPLHMATVSTLHAFQETFVITLNDYVIHGNEDARVLMIDDTTVAYVFDQLCFELERLAEWGDKPMIDKCCGEEHDIDINLEKNKLALVGLQLVLLSYRLSLPTAQNLSNEPTKADVELDVRRLMNACRALRINILHLALEEHERQESQRFPASPVVERLLAEGADVNAIDEKGNSPMHILLANNRLRLSMAKKLLDSGALLFARNSDGVVVYKGLVASMKNSKEIFSLGRYMKLSSLAANAVRRQLNVTEAEQYLPIDLKSFLQVH